MNVRNSMDATTAASRWTLAARAGALLALVACGSAPQQVALAPAPAPTPSVVTVRSKSPAPTVVALAPQAPAIAGTAAPAAAPSTAAIARRVDAHLEFLASDDLAGRETGTVQSKITGQYVAAAYRTAGLLPGGEDGYFQKFPLSSNRLDAERTSATLSAAGQAPATWKIFQDFVLRGYGDRDQNLEAELAFAGFGLVSEAHGVDEYGSLDVRGRIVVVLDGRPPLRNDLRQAAVWRAKRNAARERGAIGLVTVSDPGNAGLKEMFAAAQAASQQPNFSIPSPDSQTDGFPLLNLSASGVESLQRVSGIDFAAERAARTELLAAPAPGAAPTAPTAPLAATSRLLPGLKLTLSSGVLTETTHGYNILGLLPGSDPLLRDEVVIVSAHNDHIGVASDGDVNNGADDNASGTTALMIAAEVLAAGPAPRRSVLFLSVSGEEMGLLGSEWWCEHPTVPLPQCVANINVDMVGRNDADAIGATPSPEHEDYNTLVERAVALGPASGLRVTWTAPEAGDDRVDNYYHRSDHYHFASRGIPVVFFFSGVHEDYHRPSDEVHKLDRVKIRRVADLVARLVTDTANADQRPKELGKP
ncbi:MAG: M28 family peptidase [Planctomycetota bacterium]